MNSIRDTIVAISTPIGEGGIGIVRLSGRKSLSIADKIFVSKDGKTPSGLKTYTIHYGHIIKSEIRNPKYETNSKSQILNKNKEIIDEVLLTVMRAPKSYTKEDVVEINCHGGIVPLRSVFEEVVRFGARPAEPGEFTKRAFLNGRIDLTQAEAVIDVIRSRTDMSLKVALSHLEGDFSKDINLERENLLDILQHMEAQIDFSEEEIRILSKKEAISRITKCFNRLKGLLDTKDLGMLLKEGLLCVICGKPNTGKSSLLNALLRRNRAIVTDVPGTTRDVIEEYISIKGVPVRIVDTAGIAKGKNIIEKEAIKKTEEYLNKADLVILLLDLSRAFDKEDKGIIRFLRLDKTVVVANKSDLRQRLDMDKVKDAVGKEIVKISILEKINLNAVEEKIAKRILSGKVPHPEAAFLTNIRHKDELEKAISNLKSAVTALLKDVSPEYVAEDLKEAVFHLGLIIGKSVDIGILDRIFENFCIGK